MNRRLLFAYPGANNFSGQSYATDLAIDVLEPRGWDCGRIEFPMLDRNAGHFSSALSFAAGTARASATLAMRGLFESGTLCLNQGLTHVSLARIGIPHRWVRMFRPELPIVSSLHGMVFLEWANDSGLMKKLLAVIAASDVVTVQGGRQKKRLIEAGVPAEKVIILPNTCKLDPLPKDTIREKQEAPARDGSPLRIMHLSSLIESKGFPVFLEAIERMAAAGLKRRIEVILCGPITRSPYCHRFAGVHDATQWVDEQIEKLNQYEQVEAHWIKGAMGKDKAELFSKTHIFVMPSRYPVEAQPIVLVEAFASGCAIIASDQGEIPSTVTPEAGIILKDVGAASLAQAMQEMIENDNKRALSALAAHTLATGRFSLERHAQNWEDILSFANIKHTASEDIYRSIA